MNKRDDKERIVWQNQSHLVLEYLKHQKQDVKLLELVLITDVLAQWIMEGKSTELVNKLKEIDKKISDGK